MYRGGRKESERRGREGKGGERGTGKGRREGGQGKEERGGLNRLPLLHPFHPHAQQAQHSTAHTVSSPPAAQ